MTHFLNRGSLQKLKENSTLDDQDLSIAVDFDILQVNWDNFALTAVRVNVALIRLSRFINNGNCLRYILMIRCFCWVIGFLLGFRLFVFVVLFVLIIILVLFILDDVIDSNEFTLVREWIDIVLLIED